LQTNDVFKILIIYLKLIPKVPLLLLTATFILFLKL
jgi:hypothetical protein